MRPLAVFIATLVLFACEGKLSSPSRDGSDGSVVSAEAPASLSARPGRPASRTEGNSGKDLANLGPTAPPQPSEPSQTDDTPQQAMIIKNGDVTIQVDSLELAIGQVTALAQKLGGVVANSSIQTGQKNFRTATVVLRIPAKQFDVAMSGLNPFGKVESQNVSSEDVTEQFVDMTARMKNAKRLEERLITLLATRTGKLEDVLAVERELARVREEIERYEGQLRYLRTRAAVSTISVNLHEKYPIAGAPPGENIIVESFKRAWRNFVGVVGGIISTIGALLPLLVLAVLIVFILRKLGLLPHFNRRPPPPPPSSA